MTMTRHVFDCFNILTSVNMLETGENMQRLQQSSALNTLGLTIIIIIIIITRPDIHLFGKFPWRGLVIFTST